MPKLIMNACGDEFFLPDSSQFYFNELPGAKYLRYIPNTNHSLKNTDAFETLLAWHHATLNRTPLPQFSWKHTGYLMEMTFDIGGAAPLKLTTDVTVTPNTLPFPLPDRTSPKGFLAR